MSARDPDDDPPDPRGPLLRALFDALPDPVRVTDPRGRVLFENRRARELFTLAPAAADEVRRRVEGNNLRFGAALAGARASGDGAGELALAEPASGAGLAFELAPAALPGDVGLPTGATVSLLRPLRGPREPAVADEDARMELERAYRHKSEFLASMSHELRTPINALLGYTALLRERIYGPLNERQAGVLARMQSASGNLLDLVNDVLDLAKIEAGRMSLRLEPVALRGLVRELADAVEPVASARGLELEFDVPDDIPELTTDRLRLRQVLLNLLSNGVKFTRTGGVSLVARPVGEDRVEVEVSDTGVGIPEDELSGIFDDFHQVDQSASREFEGTGLGLSIVRKLLGLLGGSIRVQSTPGEGSVFTVTLPLRSAEVPQGEEAIRRALRGEAVIVRGGAEVPLPPQERAG